MADENTKVKEDGGVPATEKYDNYLALELLRTLPQLQNQIGSGDREKINTITFKLIEKVAKNLDIVIEEPEQPTE